MRCIPLDFSQIFTGRIEQSLILGRLVRLSRVLTAISKVKHLLIDFLSLFELLFMLSDYTHIDQSVGVLRLNLQGLEEVSLCLCIFFCWSLANPKSIKAKTCS